MCQGSPSAPGPVSCKLGVGVDPLNGGVGLFEYLVNSCLYLPLSSLHISGDPVGLS